MPIYFYSRAKEYFELSNFSPHGFELDGLYWPTVEHCFQARKFPGSDYAETIRTCDSPGRAKQLGRSRKHPLRPDWEEVKESIMKDALRAKFTTHAELRQLLLDTGDEELIENAPSDSYWGCGKSGTGKNRLGVLLMEVRGELRSGWTGEPFSDPSAATGPILFYSTGDEWGEFSNFAAFPIKLKRKTWPTSEHYFQAQKFPGTEHEEEIRKVKNPMQAARMGRQRNRPLRKDWESVKDDIMRDAVRAKFTQHHELAELLLGTGNRKLVEHTTNDDYWGDGGDGRGKNKLGQILMEVREELRAGM